MGSLDAAGLLGDHVVATRSFDSGNCTVVGGAFWAAPTVRRAAIGVFDAAAWLGRLFIGCNYLRAFSIDGFRRLRLGATICLDRAAIGSLDTTRLFGDL